MQSWSLNVYKCGDCADGLMEGKVDRGHGAKSFSDRLKKKKKRQYRCFNFQALLGKNIKIFCMDV